MAVSETTNKVIAKGNGSTRTFSFSPVIIDQSSDLVVTKRDASGNETVLSEGSSSTTYSVSVASFPGTGSIDYPASGGTLLQSGESISMKATRPLTQGVDLENRGGYFADTQEVALDKLVYIAQQQQEELDRSLKIPVTDDTTTLDTLQASLLVISNNQTNINTVAGIAANITTVAGISANVTTVAGISADVSTVAGISSDVTSVASQSFKYLFDTSTSMADPGSGDVRYNNATPASVTQIAISNTFSGGVDISPFITTWDDSVNAVARALLVIRKGGSGSVFQIFKITGAITDNGAWLQIPVTHVAGATLPTASDDLYITPVLSGADSLADKIEDTDGDTRVETENAPDEDVIRFFTANVERGSWDVTGLKLATGNRVNQFSTDGTLAADSDLKVPTEKAVKSYIDSSFARKNRIINGNFRIWQRGTSFASPSTDDYLADRWKYIASGAGAITVTEETSVVPNSAGSAIKVDVTTADASLAATDFYAIEQPIEGYNVVDALLGQSGAKNLTISFWVRSPKTGTHYVALQNGANNRSYPASYSVSSADTWEFKTITIAGDTSGTWLYTTGVGLSIIFTLAAGSNFEGTADTWNAANNFGASGGANVMDNTANNFYLAEVQLELGQVATTFEMRPVSQEYYNCFRYYERRGEDTDDRPLAVGHCPNSTNAEVALYYHRKRVVPTIGVSASGGFKVRSNTIDSVTTSVNIQQVGLDMAFVNPSGISGATAGDGAIMRMNTVSDWIEIDAEL